MTKWYKGDRPTFQEACEHGLPFVAKSPYQADGWTYFDFGGDSLIIDDKHRHHGSPVGWKFGVGVQNEKHELVGVAVAGRPVARGLDDGQTIEVTRLCTNGTPNVCSMLYSAVARAAQSLGYDKVVTYILASEPGTSLKASGWIKVADVAGRSWDCPSRPRTDKHPTVDKTRWEKSLKPSACGPKKAGR